jgi:hypothetical protein
MRWILLVMGFGLSFPAQAQMTFSERNRVVNVGMEYNTGYCAWCALEMAGRQLGVNKLRGLVKRKWDTTQRFVLDPQTLALQLGRDGSARVLDLAVELSLLRVNYLWQRDGSLDDRLLRVAHKRHVGAVVFLVHYPDTGSRHAVLLISYGKTVKFIDPDHDSGTIVRTRWWFMIHWTGAAVMLY